jgi:CRISPR-associated endonuclease/helicase Cas3
MRMLTLKDCWAKTDEQGNPALSVLEHSLNVGAVGKTILSHLSEAVTALPPSSAALLIAGHDLGKISPGFLLKSPIWREQWQGALKLEAPSIYESSHAKTSQKVIASLYAKPPRWLMALGGHHGKYLCADARPTAGIIGEEPFHTLRSELLELLKCHFGNLPSEEKIEKGPRLHWFTGLMIFSDWIGSNTTWFPLHQDGEDPASAESKAQTAINEIGWHQRFVKSGLRFQQLFDMPEPRPLQETLHQAVDVPGLYIVEAPMGDGKTEAALLAAYRRWTEGEERGIYFALPTQLTSNRIHERVLTFLSRVVSSPSSIALVHGNAWPTENRIKPLNPTSPEQTTEDEEPDQALQSNRWFSDSRRSMLAPFGVGTIDQALMAILPVKFSALRLFALAGKVIVIDEVHSYDPYTSALVDRAVKWLLEVKCTVIVLSATLTKARRAALVKAAGAQETTISESYPLLTKVPTGCTEAQSIKIPAPSLPTKTVALSFLPALSDDWLSQAVHAAEQKACVLIIRNTIALATQSFDELKSRCRDRGIEFGLIHSRFSQFDRQKNEEHWMQLLGKNPSKRPANGAILIGTQVLEQSVDIDADLLITDLAPTDLILQRIGRLHRHHRVRPAGYENPRCLILHPAVNWQADAKTLKDQLKPHRFIYPPFSLYMTDHVWRGRSEIELPRDIRNVLEASAQTPADMPAGMSELHKEFLDNVQRQLHTAFQNDVFSAAAVDDVEGTQTRWKMQASAHLVILRSHPQIKGSTVTVEFPSATDNFIQGNFHFPLARDLHLHAIRLPLYMVKDLLLSQPDWLQQHLPGSVLTVLDECGQCKPCYGPEPAAYSFTYHPTTGLRHERNKNVPLSYQDDDESWF